MRPFKGGAQSSCVAFRSPQGIPVPLDLNVVLGDKVRELKEMIQKKEARPRRTICPREMRGGLCRVRQSGQRLCVCVRAWLTSMRLALQGLGAEFSCGEELSFGDRVMKDERTLGDYNIEEGGLLESREPDIWAACLESFEASEGAQDGDGGDGGAEADVASKGAPLSLLVFGASAPPRDRSAELAGSTQTTGAWVLTRLGLWRTGDRDAGKWDLINKLSSVQKDSSQKVRLPRGTQCAHALASACAQVPTTGQHVPCAGRCDIA